MKLFAAMMFCFSLTLSLLATTGAGATEYTFNAASGYRSVSATFSAIGQDLYVTLSNNSDADAMGPTDVLTAIFFDLNADLKPVTASTTSDSTVYSMNDDHATYTNLAGGDVGGEWAYKSGISGAPGGGTKGISSSGLGIFGGNDLFNQNNLSGPLSPDGLQYGIAPKGDNPTTGNGDIVGTPLIRNAVRFLLTGLPITFDPRYDITNLDFIFGTATDVFLPPTTDTVPEPSTLCLLLMGCSAVAFGIFRKRRHDNC